MVKRLLLLLLPCATLASAQSAEQFITWGDNAMRLEDRYGASRFYKEALDQDPGRMELQWKYAEACRLSNQYPEAAAYYEKVQRKDVGGRAHPEALHWLAEMQLCSGDYDAAQKSWAKVKQHAKDSTTFLGRRARNALQGIALAKRMMAAPEEVAVEHVAMPVNSYDSEFAPSIGPDSALYFTSLRGDVNDEGEVLDTTTYRIGLYRAAMHGTQPDAPLPLLADAAVQRANPAWAADGKRFFFTAVGMDGRRSIHMSTWTNGVFGPPVALGGAVASGNASQPAFAVIDGHEQLFFTSDRDGGQGGLDIWVGELRGTDVVNVHEAGPAINTLGNECCPFYDAVQQKLYFSSDFLPGLGGYDNFMSAHGPQGWTAPVNFGYPLNGPANDLYPSFDATTMSGWFTSNRAGSFAKKGETCCNDLYRYRYPHSMPPVVKPEPKDTIPPAASTEVAQKRLTSLREKLPIRLYFHNDEPGPRSWDTTITATYAETYTAYKALVPDYHAAWKGSSSGTNAIDAFFRDEVDHGFAQLNDFIALLEQAMQEGQRIELQVRGFASPLAKSDYNRNLSLRRIQSMVNYLRSVHGGKLVPYLDGTAVNGGRLFIRKSPFGEGRSAAGISDQLTDLKNSVYGVGASLERRIEIEQVLLVEEPQATPTTQDIGHSRQEQPRDVAFVVRNTTALPLTFVDSNVSCDCVSAKLPAEPVPPFGTGTIVVHFNGHAPVGPLERVVTVVTDGTPRIIQLTITGIIDPAR